LGIIIEEMIIMMPAIELRFIVRRVLNSLIEAVKPNFKFLCIF